MLIIHTYTCSDCFYSGKVWLLYLAEWKKAYTHSLALFYLLGCSLTLNTGLRSHYILLISVADSGGTVRDCRGRREEGEAEMKHMAARANTAPNCTDRARDFAGFLVTLLQRKKNDNVCGSG